MFDFGLFLTMWPGSDHVPATVDAERLTRHVAGPFRRPEDMLPPCPRQGLEETSLHTERLACGSPRCGGGREACIACRVVNDLGDLILGDPVGECDPHMGSQFGLGTQRDQDPERDEAALTLSETLARPATAAASSCPSPTPRA